MGKRGNTRQAKFERQGQKRLEQERIRHGDRIAPTGSATSTPARSDVVLYERWLDEQRLDHPDQRR